jgi:hypothetical protein
MPALFRQGAEPGVVVDSEGNVLVADEQPAVLSRRMVAELKERREVVRDLDEVERALTESDLDHDHDAELRRLRRYEGTLHRRLQWAVKLIQQDPARRPYLGMMRTKWDMSSPPKMVEEIAVEKHVPVSIHPPFDLTEEEAPPLGQRADIPKIVKSRKRQRKAQDDSRRDVKRRKLEKLRA